MDTDSVNIRTIYDIYCWTQCGSINTIHYFGRDLFSIKIEGFFQPFFFVLQFVTGKEDCYDNIREYEYSVFTQQAFVKAASGEGAYKSTRIRGHRPGEPKDLQIALKTCNEALSEVTCAGGNLIRPPCLPGAANTQKPMQVTQVPNTDSFCCQSDPVYIILYAVHFHNDITGRSVGLSQILQCAFFNFLSKIF